MLHMRRTKHDVWDCSLKNKRIPMHIHLTKKMTGATALKCLLIHTTCNKTCFIADQNMRTIYTVEQTLQQQQNAGHMKRTCKHKKHQCIPQHCVSSRQTLRVANRQTLRVARRQTLRVASRQTVRVASRQTVRVASRQTQPFMKPLHLLHNKNCST